MKISNYPDPPYKGGRYELRLHRSMNWYGKQIRPTGRKLSASHIDEVMHILVDKIFGQDVDQEQLDYYLYLDELTSSHAAHVVAEMECQILSEITAFFPRIGGELPKEMYCFERMELVIYVPDTYEDQRGVFF